MNERSTTTRSRRLNLRGLLILGVVGLLVAAGFFGLSAYRAGRGTPTLLSEARLPAAGAEAAAARPGDI